MEDLKLRSEVSIAPFVGKGKEEKTYNNLSAK
jgi:hypothetical protein